MGFITIIIKPWIEMRAILLEGFGGVENLNLREVEEPKVGCDEVLVRVKAVALNHLDLWVRKGALKVKPKLPHILGSDVSGVVEEVGSCVKNFKRGDEVVINPNISCGFCKFCLEGRDNLCKGYDILGLRTKGGYAELLKVKEKNLMPKPKNLNFIEACAYPLTFLTAYNALVLKAKVRPNERVFFWGGSSGVGTALIQFAKLLGAKVFTSAGSEEKIKRCKELGAEEAFNHYEYDFKELFGSFDVVVDFVGSKTFEKSLKLLRKGGRLVFLGTTTGGEVSLNLRELFTREISLLGVYMGPSSSFVKINELVEEGKVKPIIDRVFDLEEAREAHLYLESSKHFGKVVLSVDSSHP